MIERGQSISEALVVGKNVDLKGSGRPRIEGIRAVIKSDWLRLILGVENVASQMAG
jgi:hypothetical protein